MFTIAIVGRPNVGKSSLFNRLCGKRHALVHDKPGVTRDRQEAITTIGDIECCLIDTAGLEETAPEKLEHRMLGQTEYAIEDAQLILFMMDGRDGVTPMDEHFAKWLHRKNANIILVVNKCESSKADDGLTESFSLGFGEPVPISAEHNIGMGDLYLAIADHVKEHQEQEADLRIETNIDVDDDSQKQPRPLQLAIVGRPNVGKSTLINTLLGKERVLTGPEAGITRDSIAIEWTFNQQPITLIDTAGIRRKANVVETLEKLSLTDTFRSIRFAHVVLLLIDAEHPLEKQDLAIANMAIKEGRALLLGVNKWDKIPEKDRKSLLSEIQYLVEKSLPEVKNIPIIPFSALKNSNCNKPIKEAFDIYELWQSYITTSPLNEWLKDAESFHPPPLAGRTRIRLKYITQAKKNPPTFTLFCNKPEKLPKSYERYLINHLRDCFGLPGIPIRLLLRKSNNPYK